MSLPGDAPQAIAGIPAEWWLRLAHDLRGPVAPMRMAVQMMRGGWVGPTDQEEALRMIDRQMDALLASIEDVGELMRLNAGAFSFQPQDADLAAVLERVAGRASLERWLQERQKQLLVEPPPGPVRALHDPQRLAALLEFLVRKAAIHAASGDTLVMALQRRDASAHWSIHGSGPTLEADPEVRLLAGQSAALEECEARALVLREVARRHRLVFQPLGGGALGFSMDTLE